MSEILPTKIDANQAYADELSVFAREFFTYFDAPVTELSSSPALLHVRLGSDLAQHFGRDDLTLRFHRSTGGEGELVAFGSRIFDRMITFLERCGALTVLRLPTQYGGGEELMRAVQPVNAGIAGLKMAEQTRLIYAYNWHITYRADDKREELLTVLLEDDGTYLETIAATEREVSTWAQLLADAEAIEVERDANGAIKSPKLPPMKQLRERAETARKYAIYHADLQAISHENDVLSRLHRALSRLKTYYDQQIEEVYDSHDPDGEKRSVLEEDLARKNQEEIENHRLHVQIRLFSYALLEVPIATAVITLHDGQQSVDIHVARNLYDGSVQRPRCHACGNETGQIALDRNGHITCDDCIEQCATCQQIYCAACGVTHCPVCNTGNCESCGVVCWSCGERACAAHVERCPICGDTICFACQIECHACSRHLCRSHMRVDGVTVDLPGASTDAALPDVEMICPDCAVRCPGCQQYSAHIDTCEASGQRFCTRCLVTCEGCGKRIGVGFFVAHTVTGAPYCVDCSVGCQQCGTLVVEQGACVVCAAAGCPACTPLCDLCHQLVCADHLLTMAGCQHRICPDHEATCSIGGEAVCPLCQTACAVCQRYYCEEHASHCTRCRREVCAECIRASGLCDTCANHDRDGEFVTLRDEACADDERVAHLMPHYRWMRTRNARYTLYIGRDREMSAALIVVQEGPDSAEVLLARRLGILDSKHRHRWA